MNASESHRELLLRYLDGQLSTEQSAHVGEWLRTDAGARSFLREVAEQAVMVVDLERIALSRETALRPRSTPLAKPGSTGVPVRSLAWRWGLVAAAAVGLLALALYSLAPTGASGSIRVARVTGSSQYFGANGSIENALRTGALLGVGDTLETRSCDAWIELELRDGSTITIAGHSTLRILDVEARAKRFKLQQGNLWVSPAKRWTAEPMFIQTPTATLEVRGAQLDIQTSTSETMVRVNAGAARVTQLLDGSVADVPADHQVAVSLSRKEALAVRPQPRPINHWSCDLGQVPAVKLGKWLPPTRDDQARLGAEPLLWPIPGRDPVTLHAVALAAWTSSERPVLLQSDSRLRIRGRTDRAQTVRFGFSTQRMRGVFSGKFEVDVKPDALGPAGGTWQVELSLASFRPLQPQLSTSPDGLELTDVYALTVKEDAGLEIHRVEMLAPDARK